MNDVDVLSAVCSDCSERKDGQASSDLNSSAPRRATSTPILARLQHIICRFLAHVGTSYRILSFGKADMQQQRLYVRTCTYKNPEFACIHVEETIATCKQRHFQEQQPQARRPKIFVYSPDRYRRSITPCPRPQLQPERGGRKNCRRRVAPEAQTTWSR